MFLDASGPKSGHGLALNAFLQKNKIPRISMALVKERAEQRVIIHPFDGHWNQLGNAIAGQVVWEGLKQQGLLR